MAPAVRCTSCHNGRRPDDGDAARVRDRERTGELRGVRAHGRPAGRADGRRGSGRRRGRRLRGHRPRAGRVPGSGRELRYTLVAHGLALAGGYVELPLSDRRAFATPGTSWTPCSTSSTPPRRSRGPTHRGRPWRTRPRPSAPPTPARQRSNRSLEMSADAWRAFVDGIAESLDRCRARGYEPTFHPELGTSIEAPAEIQAPARGDRDRAVRRHRPSPRRRRGPCCGHRRVGRSDQPGARQGCPPRSDRRGRQARRIRRCHLERGRLLSPSATGTSTSRGSSRPCGPPGTEGWIVVEQDSLPGDAATFEAATRAQRENRRVLERFGY